ncbi:MAG: aminotransferase class I/II-fold pyridoxal phosphate-dependent enzyme [Gemmatimonadaceae bacterium]
MEGYALADILTLADDECATLWRGLRLGYTESAGHPLLRAEIARLYERITPVETLTFAGAEEAIFVLMHALLGPGDHAVVTWPAYQSLHEVARATGADVDFLRLSEDTGWALELDALQRLLRPTTRLIVVNFPHNPTGTLPSAETFRALAEMARYAGCRLVSDEVYRGLEYRESDRLPAACDLYEHAISIGVMSKAYALAGLRVGWIATRDAEVLSRAAALKDYTTICNSAPSEVLALIALRAKERVLARSHGIIARNLPLLDDFFDRWAHAFAWTRPRAGSVAFPRLTAGGGIELFAAELVEQTGVLIAPGSLFGHEGEHFRLGFGREDLPDALRELDQFAADRFGRAG